MKHMCLCLFTWLGPLSLSPLVSTYQGPETFGPYATGVHDFEYTDTIYPSDFQFDAQGRRILARAWYPVCEKTSVSTSNGNAVCQSSSTVLGRQREFFEPGEWEVLTGGDPELTNMTDAFPSASSYLDTPPMANANGEFPVVIYTHGLGMWISDSTALLEEIASQGYTVFAIGSPGFSSGLLFNSTMDVITPMDYPEIMAMENDTSADSIFSLPYSDDLQVRYDKMAAYLNISDGLTFTRVQDDQLALADYLETQQVKQDELVQAILGNSPGLNALVYMGFSMGGIAAGSTAQRDPRAVGAINIDGWHQSLDLFGKPSRVPYLTFWGDSGDPPFYINEFFFEPLETMGENPNITRVGLEGIQHLDFSDFGLLDQVVREQLGFNYTVDGVKVHSILVEFCLGFLDTHLKNKEGWDIQETFDKLPGAKPVNVSYVKEWKAKETMENPVAVAEDPDSGEEESSPTLESDHTESSSPSGMEFIGWPYFGLVIVALLCFN